MKQVVVKAALMAAQMGLSMLNKTEGPRLDNLEVTTADYGTPLNYFWGKRRLEGCPIIWAERLREKKNTSKGKGGKYAEYKYFGTFAVAIADHEIDAVTRIWMDKHIVYDVTKAGPISPIIGVFTGLNGSPVKLTNGRNMRIYLGTETQEPDPRMESWCEDRYGADSCPAYRGVAYIVFENIPLEKFGNRIPQITVEAVNNSAPDYLHETFTPSAAWGPIFSPDRSRALFFNTSGSRYTIWDTATQTKLIDRNFPVGVDGVGFASNGNLMANGGTLGSTIYILSGDGAGVSSSNAMGQFTDLLTVIGNTSFMRIKNGFATGYVQSDGINTSYIDTSFVPGNFFRDLDSNPWTVGLTGTTIYLYDIEGQTEHSIASPGGATSGFVSGFANSDGNFFVLIGTTAVVIDADTFAVIDSLDIGGSGNDLYNAMLQHPSGAARFFTATKEIDASTLETIKTYSLGSWTAGNDTVNFYEPITHSLWGREIPSGNVTVRYLDRVDSSGTDLADVVQDVANRCGVVEIDVSGLTQTVPGYSVVQGAAKDWIAPLLDIHDVDARPHNFAVQFLTRGSSAAGTISVSEFVRDGDEPRYSVSIKQDTDLPRRLGVSFADNDKDQQKNTVLSQRPLDGTDGDRELTIDLSTYAATPGDAQKLSDRLFRRKWNGRESVTNALTAQYLALEPGDVWNLQLDDVAQSHRLIKATISQGRILTEWERDFPGLNLLGTGNGAEMEGRDDDEVFVPSQTKGFVLDIPLTQDAHDSALPTLHYAAGSYGGDWPGAVVYKADLDGDEYAAWNPVESVDNATWGYANEALGNSSPYLWDRGNELNVQVFGTLTSSTEAAIEANPLINLAVVGNELINFVTATLEADGTYTLSGFKRGRRGTEWAVGDHAIGDEFLLVSDLLREGIGLSEVGFDVSFKAQTLGRDVDAAPAIDFSMTGASLKPYAPARVKFSTDGTDLSGEIIRRTRIGGSWADDGVVAVSETTEAYEIDVYVGATFKRTIEVSATNEFTYTAAMMAADGTSLSSPPDFNVHQMSDAVGRGFALAA